MEWSFELIAGPYGGTTEGPVWDGEALLFTHIPTSRILRHDPVSGETTEYRTNTNRTNGLAFDVQGRLYGCCASGRSIVRFEADGAATTIVDRLNGRRLNTPNDLAIDSAGRVWFTNPWNPPNIDPAETQELGEEQVLRADPQPDGSYSLRRLTTDMTRPNGILVSPDERTLYVAQSHSEEGRVRDLRAYPILENGELGPHLLLHQFGEDYRGPQRGIDGMKFDTEGNIVATAGWSRCGPGPMIYVFDTAGRVLETHPMPEGVDLPTNLCFGGPNMDVLYVTTSPGHLFRVGNPGRRGWLMWPPARF